MTSKVALQYDNTGFRIRKLDSQKLLLIYWANIAASL